MQQVFMYVNKLFIKDAASKTRKLRIRTYNVLPLSTTAGVLQWVMHTKPLQGIRHECNTDIRVFTTSA